MSVRDKSPSMLILGLLVIITSMVTFGLVNIKVLSEAIEPIAAWVFVVGFVGVYLLSDRQLGQLKDYEGVSFIVPIVLAMSIQLVPQVKTLLTDYNPYSGITLLAITMIGFYALGTNMDLQAVTIEVILGLVLAVTASVQFGLLSIEVLNNDIAHISVWVFVIALSGAYLVSEHSIGRMKTYEIMALLIGIGGYLGYEFVPTVSQFINENNPEAGTVLVLVTIMAYYFIMNNGEIR